MLGLKSSIYWRMCWGIITPFMMIAVCFYSLITTEELLFGGTYEYPQSAYSKWLFLKYLGVTKFLTGVPTYMFGVVIGKVKFHCKKVKSGGFENTCMPYSRSDLLGRMVGPHVEFNTTVFIMSMCC